MVDNSNMGRIEAMFYEQITAVAMEMQNLIAEMQRKRAEQRKRNMEKILWLI